MKPILSLSLAFALAASTGASAQVSSRGTLFGNPTPRDATNRAPASTANLFRTSPPPAPRAPAPPQPPEPKPFKPYTATAPYSEFHRNVSPYRPAPREPVYGR